MYCHVETQRFILSNVMILLIGVQVTLVFLESLILRLWPRKLIVLLNKFTRMVRLILLSLRSTIKFMVIYPLHLLMVKSFVLTQGVRYPAL